MSKLKLSEGLSDKLDAVFGIDGDEEVERLDGETNDDLCGSSSSLDAWQGSERTSSSCELLPKSSISAPFGIEASPFESSTMSGVAGSTSSCFCDEVDVSLLCPSSFLSRSLSIILMKRTQHCQPMQLCSNLACKLSGYSDKDDSQDTTNRTSSNALLLVEVVEMDVACLYRRNCFVLFCVVPPDSHERVMSESSTSTFI